MCGIAGFIGESKQPKLSFRLISYLFKECETRGTDAAGYWGTNAGGDSIVYHKEPIRASDFVKKTVWKNLESHNLDLLLVHARGASSGVGSPLDNRNNHPFTSNCRSIGLVHNGRVPDHEYDLLSKRYEVASKCDSEILLRIFEAGIVGDEEEANNIESRLAGLRDIWSYIDKGHMAVAIGERVNNDHRRLFLFRNKWRSLWMADTRKELGQVFFCSTPEIWSAAYRAAGMHKIIKNCIKLIELPIEELWVMEIDGKNPIVQKINKHDILFEGKAPCENNGEIIPINRDSPTVIIHTKLNEDDQVEGQKNQPAVYPHQKVLPQPKKSLCNTACGIDGDEDDELIPFNDWEGNNEIGTKALTDSVKHISKMLNKLQTSVHHQYTDGRMTNQSLRELLMSMENLELDVEATLKLWMENVD